MTGSVKRQTLIWLGLVMIITAMIATSLPQLELQPGMPLPRVENDQMVVASVEAERFESIAVDRFFIVFLVILLLGSLLFGLYKLLRGAEWKSLPAYIGPILMIGLIVAGFVFLITRLFKSESGVVMEMPMPAPEPLVTSPLGPVPLLLLWLVGLGLLAAGIFIGVWLFTSSRGRATTLDIVGLEAEKAWQELKTGSGLKDVIIKCYRHMSLALAEEQGLKRENFMTTREFEDLLEAAGVPHDPIHQLTQLFEAVRYGNWQPNPVDEQKAIHCLEAIVLYSRAAKEAN